MRRFSARGLLTTLAFIAPCAGATVLACSGDDQAGSGGVDAAAADVSVADTATPDSTQGTPPDAADSSSNVPADAGADTLYEMDAGCALGPSGEFTALSCTGLYSDWGSKTVSPDVISYAPGYTFWSDGAEKQRWIYLPPGQKIDTSNMDEWTFPVGTKIWKEFRIALGDASTETRIETRLLWKSAASTWYRTTYRWSDDGTSSATELITGELDAGGTGYEIPSQPKCNQCHFGRVDGVLGFEAVALSSPNASGYTMAALTDAGLLTNPPDAAVTVPGDAVESAALGWLHMNCGTACHNSGSGSAAGTGFWMRLDVATLKNVQTTNTYTTGWNVAATGFAIPDAATTYRLHSCSTGTSCAYYRAGHRDDVDGTLPGTQMPPIDSHVVDAPDLANVAAWINEGCDGG